jgi:putative FmdB family regulatory protein
MPIYEFFCSDCNTVFNFFSRTVNTAKTPTCPKCKKRKLARQVSLFAETGKHAEETGDGGMKGGMGDLGNIDESKMEKAITALAGEAEKMNQDDPRQAAQLMRKFSSATGMKFGNSMEQALGRLEAGEDPEKIESEMGALLEGEDEPFMLPEKGGKGPAKEGKTRAPQRDSTLYDL